MSDYIVLELLENGPILVRGAVSFISKTGPEPKNPAGIIALCRCGCSRNKPFCDNSHIKIRVEMPQAEIE